MSAPAKPRRWWRRLVLWPLGLVVIVAFYYAAGGHLAHVIDDDPVFVETVDVPEGGSATVAMTAALIAREVDQHGWVANDPVVFPTHMLDDMANYQRALVAAAARMIEDIQGWVPGEAPNSDLEEAAGAFAMPGDIWTFDFARAWAPQKTTEQFYRDGAAALHRFNAAVATGRLALAPVQLSDTLTRFADELDAAEAANLRHVRARGGHWLDTDVDDRFMTTKGLLYAHYVLLAGLERDFAGRFDATAAREALARAMALGPWLVMNGVADAQFRPSHLAAQAAYVGRAALAVRALAAASGGSA